MTHFKGDPLTRALLDLTAGRGLPEDAFVDAGFVELAQTHGLSSVLVDEVHLPVVRAVHGRSMSRQQIMRGHLRRVLELLDAAGVKAAPLKGPRVADTFYTVPSHRIFTDLDLLVEASALDEALDVIANDKAVARVPEKKPKADKRDILLRDASGMIFNLDLHWDLFAYSQLRGAADGATQEAWSRARFVQDSPLGPHWTLPLETELCFLAAHAILDHRFRLILFRDFVELASPDLPWDDVLEASDRWGLRSTTYLPLWLSARVFGAAVPEEALTRLRPRSMPVSYLEWALPRTDLVRFDGHRPHPVNLAAVLLNDSVRHRLSLALRAPRAFPSWRRRVALGPEPADPPRILIVVSTNRRRGAEVFAERLRDGLLARGWMVEATSLSSGADGVAAEVHPLSARPPEKLGRLDFGVLAELRRRIRVFGADVVIANGGATLRYSILATLASSVRTVYIGIGEPRFWIRSSLSKLVNRWLLRRADHVLAVSERTRDQLVELEPSILERVDVAYTGVPDHLFRLNREKTSEGLNVVMLGSLSTEKDPLTALRVAAAVDDVCLRFVGDGPLRAVVEAEARRLRVADRVGFIGAVDDVTPHLEWADALILTSLTEGLPGAVLEAGASGLATVTVEVGGVREAVVDGVTGFILSPGDEEGLVAALKTLAGDRKLLDEMGRAARFHISASFRMDRVVDRYEEFMMRFST